VLVLVTAMGPSLPARIYRENAAECVRLAAATDDAEMRNRLMEVAAMWHRLAEQIEDSEDKDK
jgi:hypothetical protein